jgi:membrane protein DedA with SNARE-associated domain
VCSVHGALPLGLHASPHVHHVFHGARIDYLGVAVAAMIGALGVTGPGEAALVAGGLAAAHHHLAISAVVAAAWAGSMLGSVAGWYVGRRWGRDLMRRPGPLARMRRRLLASSERLYARWAPLAVYATPAWMAGINAMAFVRFGLVSAAVTFVWAAGIGLGAYYAGPSVLDVASDVGVAGLALFAGAVAIAWLLGRRHRSRS